MRPSIPLLILTVLWCLAGFPVLILPEYGPVWGIAGITLAAAALLDAVLGMFRRRSGPGISITSTIPESTVLNTAFPITVSVSRSGGRIPRRFRLIQDLPPHVEVRPYPLACTRSAIPESGSRIFRTEGMSRRRCRWESPGFTVAFPGPFGLFEFHSSLAGPGKSTTYPDLGVDPRSAAIERYRTGAGLVPVRQRGEGTDFKELRDYSPGDSVRKIDWRATSRRTEPVVRSYQEDRDQQVLIVLDGGYRLHQKEGEVTQFEHALSAALKLSRVALDHGDSVGMYAYGSEDRWIAPGKGRSWFWKLVKGMYDFESAPAASSPAAALEKVFTRLNRRTLLVVITNLREEDGEMVEWMLPLVRGRHLMMTVTLREQGAAGPAVIEDLDDALEYGAAALYREQRVRIRRYWEKQGIRTLDTRPSELSGRLINRYLEMKTAGIL